MRKFWWTVAAALFLTVVPVRFSFAPGGWQSESNGGRVGGAGWIEAQAAGEMGRRSLAVENAEIPSGSDAGNRTVSAAGREWEEDGGADSLLDELDLGRIQDFLDRESLGERQSLSFKELLRMLLAGDFMEVFHECLVTVRENLFGEIKRNGAWIGQVLALGLVGAVFANFAGIFSSSQISETGFYVTYLLMFTFLASSFFTAVSIAESVVSNILEFMRALLPAYFLSVSFAGGSISSSAGSGLMLLSLSAVEWLFFSLFLPLLRVYILFVLAGHLMKEDIFSKMTELLEKGIRWGMKTAAGVVLGLHLLQSMVLPYADALKNTSLQRFVSVIPGLGQGAAAASQMVMGAGVLIKNTIGAGAVIVLILISVVPILKLAVMLVFYQGAAALLQPVSDKRMVSCISAVGDGCQLLLRMAVTAILLFAVSLAVVCMAANTAYYAG